MSAEAHLEVYRRFQGKLSDRPLRSWPLFTTGLRTALKQRRALVILYLPAVIATAILCVFVYVRFAAESVIPGEELGIQEQIALGLGKAQVEKLLAVKRLILEFNKAMGVFALLATAWFGSGLLCEDRKAGAHQLYFARPLTRLDYFLGKFLTAAFFALCAMMAPALIVCLVAAIYSPEWSFLKEEWDVPLRAMAFSGLWTVTVSSLVLAFSSLASRRSFAILGVFGFLFLTLPVAEVLGQFVSVHFYAFALLEDLNTLAYDLFGDDASTKVVAGDAWIAVLGLIALSWGIIAVRLRRLEVVA